MKIELLHVPGCPYVANARRLLQECLAELKITAHVEEHQGAYPSPTILLDGRDMMGGSCSQTSPRMPSRRYQWTAPRGHKACSR